MRVACADVEGRRTRFYRAGAGPAVIFVHGLGAAADTWVRNLDEVASRGFEAWAPDLPGHGFSDAVARGSNTPQRVLTDHLFAFMDSQRIDSGHLVGTAFGALIAALAYLERPSRVRSLSLVSSASVFHAANTHGSVIDASVSNQSRALENPTRETIRSRNVGSNFNRSDTFEEIVLVQLNYFALPDRYSVYLDMTAGMRNSMSQPEAQVSHRLEQLACPTLVIAGRNDPRADWHQVEAGASRLPNARLRILDNCGHKPHSEQAVEFNRELAQFLSDLPV